MTAMRRRENKRFGWRRSLPDWRDRRFAIPQRFLEEVPTTVDLTGHCPSAMNQGALGSCVPHGVTAAMRADRMNQGLPDKPLSRLQLYYDGRAAEGTLQEDAGLEIRTAIKCVAKIGVAEETFWPYMPSKYKLKPPPSAYRRAKANEALEYRAVDLTVHAIKAALASGHPVVFGVSVFENFDADEVTRTGVIPMPKGSQMGGHCMYLHGYDDAADPTRARGRNSWGPDWGCNRGDFTIPWEYLTDRGLADDFWIVTMVGAAADAPPPK